MSDHTRLLPPEELESLLAQLPAWSLTETGALSRTFSFSSFSDALGFVVRLGVLAEKRNHHPEFTVSYKDVAVTTCTHDADDQITSLDLEIAKELDAIVQSYPG